MQLGMDEANELKVGFIENLQHVWSMQRTVVLHQRWSEELAALQICSLFLNYVTMLFDQGGMETGQCRGPGVTGLCTHLYWLVPPLCGD